MDGIKDTVHGRLRHDQPGPGYCHFPTAPESGYVRRHFEGLLSEKRVIEIRGSRRISRWKVVGTRRNEPLDLRVYAYAALWIHSPDLSVLSSAPAKQARRKRSGRRVRSRGI